MTADDPTPTGDTPTPPEPCPRCAKWRRLALYGAEAIDAAIDSDPGEARAILCEAVSELEGAIDELDTAA